MPQLNVFNEPTVRDREGTIPITLPSGKPVDRAFRLKEITRLTRFLWWEGDAGEYQLSYARKNEGGNFPIHRECFEMLRRAGVPCEEVTIQDHVMGFERSYQPKWGLEKKGQIVKLGRQEGAIVYNWEEILEHWKEVKEANKCKLERPCVGYDVKDPHYRDECPNHFRCAWKFHGQQHGWSTGPSRS